MAYCFLSVFIRVVADSLIFSKWNQALLVLYDGVLHLKMWKKLKVLEDFIQSVSVDDFMNVLEVFHVAGLK